MKFLILISFFILTSTQVHAQSPIPVWFVTSFKQLKLEQKYETSGYIKPSFLQADFNGDGIMDIAALVIEKKTKKKGILLIYGKSNQYFVFGAGTNFGNGSDDFKWARGWRVYNSKIAYETTFNEDGDILGAKKIKLSRKAFYIYDLEDGEPNSGGIIYWNCKKYIWIHQGE
ncbi:MAG TPA: hypothetical protein VGI43_13745 [Mucilaginibacter sp.]|jgi:hypothetical protein